MGCAYRRMPEITGEQAMCAENQVFRFRTQDGMRRPDGFCYEVLGATEANMEDNLGKKRCPTERQEKGKNSMEVMCRLED